MNKKNQENNSIFPKMPRKIVPAKDLQVILKDVDIHQDNNVSNDLKVITELKKDEIKLVSDGTISEEFSEQVMSVIYQKFGANGVIDQINNKKQELQYLDSMIEARRKSLIDIENSINQLTENSIQEYANKLEEMVHFSLEKYKEALLE